MWNVWAWTRAMGTFVTDVLAYVPPAGAGVGHTWQVDRPRVVFLALQYLSNATGGATALAEQAVCTFEDEYVDDDMPKAVISIANFREPTYDEPSLLPPNQYGIDALAVEDRPVVSPTSSGELTVNLQTGAMSLQLSTVFEPDERGLAHPVWRNGRYYYVVDGQGPRSLSVDEQITLEPLPSEDAAEPAGDPEDASAPPAED